MFLKSLIISDLLFLSFLVGHGWRSIHVPMGFVFYGNLLEMSGLDGVGLILGGTTGRQKRLHKTLIVNTVSVSFSGNRVPITSH